MKTIITKIIDFGDHAKFGKKEKFKTPKEAYFWGAACISVFVYKYLEKIKEIVGELIKCQVFFFL